MNRGLRIVIGLVSLVIGLFSVLIAMLNLVQRLSHDQALDALFLLQFALYAVIGLGYLVIGVWNLAAFSGRRKGPVVAALVMSTLGLVFGAVYVVSLQGAPQATQGGGLVLNLLIIVLAGVLLRPARKV